jgi:biofilm PGA synthesis N-glycosyltransferase PgaC
MPKVSLPPYIIITSVKDEAAHLKTVVDSLCAQNPAPARWYITDDGSSDGSLEILREAAKEFPFIALTEKPKREGRCWGVQYRNMNDMYARATGELEGAFAYVGVHDADVAVDPDFYQRLLTEAIRYPSLGMIGGVIYQPNPRTGEWKSRSENASDSVPGSVLISRGCFDTVGGYTPMELGETDWLFQQDAMRLGFGVKVVKEAVLREYRRTANTTIKGSFKAGKMDASVGSDPLFEVLKCARRALHSPLGLNGILRLAGYLSFRLTRPPSVSPVRYNYLRSIQRAKLSGKRAA